MELVPILEEVGVIVELGNEFFEVVGVGEDMVVGGSERVEETVRMVEATTLELLG